jgi:hypothetical protein
MARKEQHYVVWDTLASLPFDVCVIYVHLVQVSPCNISFNKGTLRSSMGVSMNTQNSATKEQDQITPLLIVHKQAKFWTTYSCKYVPWAFLVVNNVDIPNCDLVQQLKCSICFPHVIHLALIEKKTKQKKKISAYKKSFGIGLIKQHVEFEHVKLIATYVVEVFAIEGIRGS